MGDWWRVGSLSGWGMAPWLTRWMLFGGRPTEACLGGRGGSGPLDGTRLPPARHRVDRCVGWSQTAHAAGYAHTCSSTIQPSTPHPPRGEEWGFKGGYRLKK